jgi:simple sugar transport system substrate-binding protein
MASVYDARFTQTLTWLALLLAMTKTNTLGFVGSFPIPDKAAQHQRALPCTVRQPENQTRVVWVNSWFDIPKKPKPRKP